MFSSPDSERLQIGLMQITKVAMAAAEMLGRGCRSCDWSARLLVFLMLTEIVEKHVEEKAQM